MGWGGWGVQSDNRVKPNQVKVSLWLGWGFDNFLIKVMATMQSVNHFYFYTKQESLCLFKCSFLVNVFLHVLHS